MVKHVRGNLTGPEAVTPAEKPNRPSTLSVGPARPGAEPAKHPPTILVEQDSRQATPVAAEGIQPPERALQVLFDLSDACNVTAEELTATPIHLRLCLRSARSHAAD